MKDKKTCNIDQTALTHGPRSQEEPVWALLYCEERDCCITVLPIRWNTWALLLLSAIARYAHRSPSWRIPTPVHCPRPANCSAIQSRQEMCHQNKHNIPMHHVPNSAVPRLKWQVWQKNISQGQGCQKVTWLSSIQTIGGLLLGESDKSRITSLTWKGSSSNLRITMKPLATFLEERNSTLQTSIWGRWAKLSWNSATETYFWA